MNVSIQYQKHRVTYQELAANYGEKMANALVWIVEKKAQLKHDSNQPDKNTRLQRALDALDKTEPHFA
jgi:hypothetical protein